MGWAAHSPLCVFRAWGGDALECSAQPPGGAVNIEIMRTFVRLRRILASHAELATRLESLEEKFDEQFRVVFDAIRQFMSSDVVERALIGFKVKEEVGAYQ